MEVHSSAKCASGRSHSRDSEPLSTIVRAGVAQASTNGSRTLVSGRKTASQPTFAITADTLVDIRENRERTERSFFRQSWSCNGTDHPQMQSNHFREVGKSTSSCQKSNPSGSTACVRRLPSLATIILLLCVEFCFWFSGATGEPGSDAVWEIWAPAGVPRDLWTSSAAVIPVSRAMFWAVVNYKLRSTAIGVLH